MQKEINNFLNEITDNFSELFVEAFLIRYESLFNDKYLKANVSKVINMLNNKIIDKFSNMGL